MNGGNVMIVVAYAAKYGSSRDVAEHIARRVRERDKQTEARSTEALSDLCKPEAVMPATTA
jgi:menaquinone-dependent protoporphyrinogen IX oxidase